MRRLDSKRELVEYFKKNLSKNYTVETLKFALEKQGYSRAAIDTAITIANKELAEKAPVLKEKPIIKYELYDKDDNLIQVESFTTWEKIKFFFKGRNL